MRQSFSRSAIYIVIGLGLFVFAVSQWKRDTGPGSTFDVTHRISVSPPASGGVAEPTHLAQLPKVQIEQPLQVPAQLPQVTAKPLQFALNDDFNEGLNDDSNEPLEVDVIEALPVDSPMETQPEVEQPVSTVEQESELEFDFAELPQQDLDSNAALEITDLPTLTELPSLPAVTMESETEIETEMETVSQSLIIDQPATPVTADVTSSAPLDIQQARRGWQSNPFLKTGSRGFQTSFEQSDQNEMIEPALEITEGLIQSEFEDSADQLAQATKIEPDSQLKEDLSFPAIDQDTMQSVIASEENHESDSPSVMLGLSQKDAQKAVHNIEYGKSLSRRGAAFAARQEFYASLRILAQSHDQQHGGVKYTQALRNGIIALKEAEDFIVADTESQIGLKVPNVIETHTTKIISAENAKGMTAIEAMQRYFAYASHQLARSGGQNVVAAECFFCLGKLHSVQAKLGASPSKLDIAKSLVFHQAAVSADPSNFRSLNELGVLYANSGRFEESKEMLINSLRFHQLPQAWENLAVVHQRLGEDQLAELANQEFKMISTRSPRSAIQWTAVEEFNKNAPLMQRTAAESGNVVAPAANSPDTSNIKSFGNRILNRIR